MSENEVAQDGFEKMVHVHAECAIDRLFHPENEVKDVKVYLRPRSIKDILEQKGAVTSPIESGGPEWDFSCFFEHQGNTYLMTGDGYSDNAVVICLEEGDEE